jgi:hypothetical protein
VVNDGFTHRDTAKGQEINKPCFLTALFCPHRS